MRRRFVPLIVLAALAAALLVAACGGDSGSGETDPAEAVPPALIAQIQAKLRKSESEGQRRMLALHGGSAANLEVSPNLWAGVGLGRGGAGTALVGSHQEIAERIEEYSAAGIDEFVLSGYPHLEELYWFGEGVLPLLERRGLWRPPAADADREPVASGREGSAVPFAVGAQR